MSMAPSYIKCIFLSVVHCHSTFIIRDIREFVENAIQEIVENPARAITATLRYTFLSKPKIKHSAISDDIMCTVISKCACIEIHDVPVSTEIK